MIVTARLTATRVSDVIGRSLATVNHYYKTRRSRPGTPESVHISALPAKSHPGQLRTNRCHISHPGCRRGLGRAASHQLVRFKECGKLVGVIGVMRVGCQPSNIGIMG